MADLLAEFLVETGEQLDELDAPCALRAGAERCRVAQHDFPCRAHHHGNQRFFELPRLAKLAHAAEALMGHYRDGPPVSAEGITVILASLERFKEILAQLGRDGAEPQGSDDDLIQRLEALTEEQDSPGKQTSDEEQETSPRLGGAGESVQPQAATDKEPAPSPVTITSMPWSGLGTRPQPRR